MLNSSEEKSQLAHETCDLNPYIAIGFVLRVGDTEELPEAFVIERLDSYVYLNQECSSLTPMKDDL